MKTLNHFEIVQVRAPGKYHGKLGVIGGISKESGSVVGYSVAFGDVAATFSPEQIAATGAAITEESYWKGNWIGRLQEIAKQ